MLTRRTAIGAGIGFASLTGATALAAVRPSMHPHRDVQPVDALLVDATVDMPRQVAALIKLHWRTVPVIQIHLDAAAHGGLRRALDNSQVIAGISSGATLFCVERIAWDHGFRLAGRNQDCAASLDGDAPSENVIAFLMGAYPCGNHFSVHDRAFRPTREDGSLHAWIMRKSARRQKLQAPKGAIL